MKYIITGITGTRNRGVEALLTTTLDEIRLRDQQAEFVVLTTDPAFDSWRHAAPGVRFLGEALPFLAPGWRSTREVLKFLWRRRGRRWLEAVDTFRRADVVIASGGDSFSSDYGTEILSQHMAVLRTARALGRPIVFLGHSIGPFRRVEEAEQWRALAACSTLVTLRESLSFDYVTRDLRVTGPRIERTADVAFLLRPAGDPESLLQGLGLECRRPVVGCAISQGIARYGQVNEKEHHESWRLCIEHLAREMAAEVLLIPHVQEVAAANDDAVFGMALLRSLSREARSHTRLAAGDYTAAEYKAMVGRCEMIVAERMHAAIAGLSSGVATVAVGYSVKARGILTDLLGERVRQDGILLPIESFLNAPQAIACVEKVFGSRHRVAASLRSCGIAVEKQARRNFELLNELAQSVSVRSKRPANPSQRSRRL